MTECYFTPKKGATSVTICANCGEEKMLHTIGEGIKVNEVIIITEPKYPATFDLSDIDIIDLFGMDDDDETEFYPCDNCDLPDACEDFGCAIKNGIGKPPEW